MSPDAQLVQAPLWQTGVATGQTFPHAPQLTRVWRLRQTPLQFVVPAGQPTHVPLWQTGVAAGQA